MSNDNDGALERAEVQIATLTAALQTRTVIGQATGLLMRDLDVSAADAFKHLIHLSSNTNVKLREVALRIVAQAEGEREARVGRGDIGELGAELIRERVSGMGH